MRRSAARSAAALALGVFWTLAAHADQWPAPVVQEVFSENRDYFVRIVPGTAIEHVVGFGAGGEEEFAPDARYAAAEFYERRSGGSYARVTRRTLLNPIAPQEFHVANDGRLATVDNWHNRGYGAVVVVYAATGEVVRAHHLTDLFLPSEITEFAVSVSSIWWREGSASVGGDQGTLYLATAGGGHFQFGLETGAFKYCEERRGRYQCRVTNEDREWADNALLPDPR